ncbi:MAG TPA: penicillin acylase family protein [Acidimicrobiales bacterium]|nr:penicillin acylase family protein [Acidimicrobiales bacterium]
MTRVGGRSGGRTVLGMLAALALAAGAAACSDDDDADDAAGEVVGDVVGIGDTYRATIRRTSAGVPHITAESSADLAFGQGWASGEDRACDLADQVVKIRGERARWFGAGEDDANVDSDIAWKAIGIFELASADWERASDGVVELVTAFSAGWNAQLDEVGADGLPGWCAGEEWVRPLEPVEVYAYARSIALQASSGALSDFIAGAQPPGGAATAPPSPDEAAAAPIVPPTADAGSNGWAIGAERSAEGGGMLVANPHFPWEGELRFWEVQLTIPGELNAYGVQLSGLPGIGIGFTENFGWTHTVSAGNRFTAYRLDLVPGSPTSYVYGDGQREMTSQDVTAEVRGADGRLSDVTRTMWSSHYGPIIDFPGFGWTDAATITYRDANLDNDEFIDQYLGMLQAEDLDEFIEVHHEVNGVPLFNTIAVSDDGRAWYADTSATPNLSDEAIAAYEASLESDPIVRIAADNGAVLLDGSDPVYEWVDEDGARDPGLVPAADQPMVERDDYVFNANDSFWLPHATEMLEGDYSPLHGAQRTARSPRTRENAVVLGDTTTAGPAGEDGAFTLDELAAATVQNRGYTSRVLLQSVVQRCRGATTIDVPAQEPPDGGGPAPLPAARIDVGSACRVLAGWDGVYDVERAGPPLWRELLARVDTADLNRAGAVWAEPFDPDRPVDTPAGLAPAPGDAPDPVLISLARAVQSLEAAGFAADAALGEVQFALRDGERIPIHGGDARDGTTNIVGWGTGSSILDPRLADTERETLVPGSSLARVGGQTGYPINNGTSFLMALAFTDDGTQARVFLTYGETEDRSSDVYTEATEAFSAKAWRDVAFTDAEIEADLVDTVTVRG